MSPLTRKHWQAVAAAKAVVECRTKAALMRRFGLHASARAIEASQRDHERTVLGTL